MKFFSPSPSTGPRIDPAGAIFDLAHLRSGDRYANETAIRALCRVAYLGDRIALARVLGRYKLYVDTTDVGLASHLMLDGYWEMWNTEAMLGLVRQGMTVLDVGAHCGYFSTLLAELAGASGRLLCFEPNPPMAELLRRSLAINGFGGRAAVHEAALGDRDGDAALVVPAHEPKNAHVGAAATPGALTVRTARLDTVPGALDADFIKIDAEGAEEAIWRGMTGLLARQRPLTVMLEFTPGRYRDAARFLDEILGYGFALATVSFTEGVVATSRAEVLAAPPAEDQMLVLTR